MRDAGGSSRAGARQESCTGVQAGMRIAIALALMCAFALACASFAASRAAAVELNGRIDESMEVSDPADGFPAVDWDYWLGVNPNVVGWVTIPGTAVDGPVVHAAPGEGDFYLSHGVDKEADPMGCAFLDSDCAAGFDSANCVTYGHNWSEGRMFADVAKFPDEGYARDHETILLQTPESKRRLRVQCVEVAPGSQPTNTTSLGTADELKCWFQARYAASQVKLAGAPVGDDAPERVYTFCTCVDDESVDARVLVYAVAT